MKQKVKYSIEPRIKKRWFRESELYYDLIKETELYSSQNAKIGKLNIEFFPQKEIKTVSSSKDINEVLIVIENLNKVK